MKRSALLLAAASLLASASAHAQEYQTRTLDELKQEAQARVDRKAYPLAGLKPGDVREALANIHSLDRDEWAAEWMRIGDRYFDRAGKEEPTDPKAALADYHAAWRVYDFGRWPVTNSPKKIESYNKERTAFFAAEKLSHPGIEVVRIPFEGKEIVGYLHKPEGVAKAPVIIDIGGVDEWKETVTMDSQAFLTNGIADFAIDMPGTGESPVQARPGAERVYSRVIDWLLTRPDIDGKKIAVRGESWGSYWAARVAFAEPVRLRAAVYQSGGVDAYFQRSWQDTSLKTKEYLFDFVPSRLFITSQPTVEAMLDYMPGMSLKPMLDKPTPPMLLITGMHDTQVPYSDLLLLLTHGSAKYAWLNPEGGHMGRTKTFSDEMIFETVVMPWLVSELKQPVEN